RAHFSTSRAGVLLRPARSAKAKQMSAAGLRDYPPGEEARARDFYGKGLRLSEIERPTTLADRDGIPQ
ncbi:MAG TPA: hypothetical protein VGQ86_10145, partial [Candidatus Limnocylindria bacterium]|nr:hypothetical protein [Candidatus Limnocylindria bacterium]